MSGAALGAVLGIYLSLPVLAIQGLAFVGGLAAVAAVYLIAASIHGRDPILVLVLGGIVVGSLLGSGVALMKFLADPYNQLPAITFWLLGSLAAAHGSDLQSLAPTVLVALLPLLLLRWRIDVMTLGDDEARALGVDPRLIRAAVIAAATLMTAVAVSVSGIIGWVGLVVPHLVRLVVGPAFVRLLPMAILVGAGYLLAVDTLARTLGTVELPLGVLTAAEGEQPQEQRRADRRMERAHPRADLRLRAAERCRAIPVHHPGHGADGPHCAPRRVRRALGAR
jgi:iron complex transport system permease protein